MKIHTSLLLGIATFGLALPAAAERSATHSACAAPGIEDPLVWMDSVQGTVQRVSSDGFELMVGEEIRSLRTNDETEYLLDQEKADRSAVLRAGAEVTVTHEGDLASSVKARSAPSLDAELTYGTVQRVSSDSFVLMAGEETLTVRTDDETEYQLDGEKADRGDVLRTGAQVAVTHKDGLASMVKARSAPALAEEATQGTVQRVSEEGFVLMIGEEILSLRTNAETEYQMDGEEAERRAVLRAGAQVEVQHSDGLATRVSAQSSAL